MFTVAVLSQKGGTGKTTMVLHLAVAAEKAGRLAAVIDLDPQASAAGWKDSRKAETPVVVSVPSARLPQALEASRRSARARLSSASSSPIRTAPRLTPRALSVIARSTRPKRRRGFKRRAT